MNQSDFPAQDGDAAAIGHRVRELNKTVPQE